jgi:hypothetical protein
MFSNFRIFEEGGIFNRNQFMSHRIFLLTVGRFEYRQISVWHTFPSEKVKKTFRYFLPVSAMIYRESSTTKRKQIFTHFTDILGHFH